jgi:hypothetical protein
MKSSNYVIYLKKRMDMGKCTLNKNKKEYKFQQKYCYFGKTFKEQAREVHVRII